MGLIYLAAALIVLGVLVILVARWPRKFRKRQKITPVGRDETMAALAQLAAESRGPEQYALLCERLAWLEREMVRVLWTLISGGSMMLGFVVANVSDQRGWTWVAVFILTWLIVGFIVQRHEFKGAPRHIEFIDA